MEEDIFGIYIYVRRQLKSTYTIHVNHLTVRIPPHSQFQNFGL